MSTTGSGRSVVGFAMFTDEYCLPTACKRALSHVVHPIASAPFVDLVSSAPFVDLVSSAPFVGLVSSTPFVASAPSAPLLPRIGHQTSIAVWTSTAIVTKLPLDNLEGNQAGRDDRTETKLEDIADLISDASGTLHRSSELVATAWSLQLPPQLSGTLVAPSILTWDHLPLETAAEMKSNATDTPIGGIMDCFPCPNGPSPNTTGDASMTLDGPIIPSSGGSCNVPMSQYRDEDSARLRKRIQQADQQDVIALNRTDSQKRTRHTRYPAKGSNRGSALYARAKKLEHVTPRLSACLICSTQKKSCDHGYSKGNDSNTNTLIAGNLTASTRRCSPVAVRITCTKGSKEELTVWHVDCAKQEATLGRSAQHALYCFHPMTCEKSSCGRCGIGREPRLAGKPREIWPGLRKRFEEENPRWWEGYAVKSRRL